MLRQLDHLNSKLHQLGQNLIDLPRGLIAPEVHLGDLMRTVRELLLEKRAVEMMLRGDMVDIRGIRGESHVLYTGDF
jgi:hypothetical protein